MDEGPSSSNRIKLKKKSEILYEPVYITASHSQWNAELALRRTSDGMDRQPDPWFKK